jgi:hypothetical protein
MRFDCTLKDFELLTAICDRVEGLVPYPDKRATLLMDLNGCHSNGCRLRLHDMLHGTELDLLHDVFGIRSHIDRRTGVLGDCFWPRYAEVQ